MDGRQNARRRGCDGRGATTDQTVLTCSSTRCGQDHRAIADLADWWQETIFTYTSTVTWDKTNCVIATTVRMYTNAAAAGAV